LCKMGYYHKRYLVGVANPQAEKIPNQYQQYPLQPKKVWHCFYKAGHHMTPESECHTFLLNDE
ncbi:MAG: hypothetical protein EBT28_07215, partial [Betaproteobacteria bacterium]|nr:hypothetical protein [Betaproteobacteria bacterium]